MADNSATLGLKFDLSAWRTGIRDAAAVVRSGLDRRVMQPFADGVRATMRAALAPVRAFANATKALLQSALGPLVALFAVQRILAGIKSAVIGSRDAFRAYADSVTVLRASLRSINASDVEGGIAAVQALGAQLRAAMGLTQTETNSAFATFVTRGFDESQARQLTILAANYAKKAGKPLADTTKMIADAANGSINAIKELGLEMASTGNAVVDAEAAVLALKGAYGDIGSELANPSERLSAAWQALAVSLGERISPIIEPIVEGFSDFVSGLIETETGKEMLDGIASTMKAIVDWIAMAIRRVSGFVSTVVAGGRVVREFIEMVLAEVAGLFHDMVAKLPGGEFILRKMGFEGGEQLSAALRANADDAGKSLRESLNTWSRERDAWLNDEVSGDSALGKLGNVMEAGRAARESAVASLSEEMAGGRDRGFSGRRAQDVEAQKAAAAAAAEEQRRAAERVRAQQALDRRANIYADANPGARVSVTVRSTRPDRLRKVRPR